MLASGVVDSGRGEHRVLLNLMALLLMWVTEMHQVPGPFLFFSYLVKRISIVEWRHSGFLL